MKYVSTEGLIQDLAVLRKKFTGQTAPYDRTLETLAALNPDAVVPDALSARVLVLAMTADRSVVEALKSSVGAIDDRDVKFYGTKAEYLLKIARVLYGSSK